MTFEVLWVSTAVIVSVLGSPVQGEPRFALSSPYRVQGRQGGFAAEH